MTSLQEPGKISVYFFAEKLNNILENITERSRFVNTLTDVTNDSLSHKRTGFIFSKSTHPFSIFQHIRNLL